MPSFNVFDEAVVASLKTVPGIRKVEEYAGDLSASALKKIAPKDGGIMLVPLGGAPAQDQPSTGQLAWQMRIGAFIVTRNARGSTERTKDARKLAQAVMLHIKDNQWGLNDTHLAVIEKLENRSAGKADSTGYAVWLVVFRQVINLDEVAADDAVFNTLTINNQGDTEQVLAA